MCQGNFRKHLMFGWEPFSKGSGEFGVEVEVEKGRVRPLEGALQVFMRPIRAHRFLSPILSYA